MAKVHSGGKVGKAGKTLQNPKSTQTQKSNAAKTLVTHKNKSHK